MDRDERPGEGAEVWGAGEGEVQAELGGGGGCAWPGLPQEGAAVSVPTLVPPKILLGGGGNQKEVEPSQGGVRDETGLP